jgi:hypothetical protein
MMSKYEISYEARYYLDAILPTFRLDRIAAIRHSMGNIYLRRIGSPKVDVEELSMSIKIFLEQHGFGHSADYVFIIDKKGMDLKNCGSLAAYEEKYPDS